MAAIKFTNYAHSQLAVGLAIGGTSLTVTGGHGARFPTLGVGEYFYLTLENASLAREIVKVTARATDVMTIVRAQDNTTALAWNAADSVALRFNAAAIEDSLGEVVGRTSATGSAILPSGTSGQRDTPAYAGYIRWNSALNQYEGYTGAAWSSIGGGATGAEGDTVFVQNNQAVTASYSIPTGQNASSVGPITVPGGIAITVPSGSRWVVL